MDSNSAAVIALIVAALPLFLVASVVVVVTVVVVLILAFFKLLDSPPRYWVLTFSVALDFVLLGPLAVVSLWVSNQEPTLWMTAKAPVIIFAAILLISTGLQWIYCQYRDNHGRKHA